MNHLKIEKEPFMPGVDIQLLGHCRVQVEDTALPHGLSPRLQSLLAYIVLHRDAPIPRQHLAFIFWPNSAEDRAQTSLRVLLHRLRDAIPHLDHYLIAHATTVEWRPDPLWALDIAEFETCVAQAAEAERTGNTQAAYAAWQSAVDLYRGDLLPACYDEWIIPQRERLREMFVTALARLAAHLAGQAQYARAIPYAERRLQLDPLDEATYRDLIRLHGLMGDRAGVQRVYQMSVAVLATELGVPPSQATREAYERYIGVDVFTGPSTPPDTPTPPPIPNNLPSYATSFVGREREVSEVKRLVRADGFSSRPRPGSLPMGYLVTLAGPGGCGKTRLALRVAEQLLREHVFSDGVWWVELAGLSAPELVAQAVASALGVYEKPGQPLIETLVSHLEPRRLLLVLDNCEHLIGACAALANRLVHACPGLAILATSREPLEAPGSRVWAVPALSLPADAGPTTPNDARRNRQDAPGIAQYVAHITASDAVHLFIVRALDALPTFRLTRPNVVAAAHICRRLDGLPLAIELAAARVKMLSVEQIAERLDDAFRLLTRGSPGAPDRHRTLRATIDWSHGLLSEKERVLFRRLGGFAGGFTLAATEAICAGAGLADDEILDLLTELLDKSLVVADTVGRSEARYRLLETIRQYALDKLEASGDLPQFRARHLEWCLGLAERAQSGLMGHEQPKWLTRLEEDHDNMRAALSWALAHEAPGPRSEAALRLCAALWKFWRYRCHLSEGYTWIVRALTADQPSPDPAPLTLRASVAWGAGMLAAMRRMEAEATVHLEASLRLWTAAEEPSGMAGALVALGARAANRGDMAEAIALQERALSLYEGQGQLSGMTYAHNALGESLRAKGDLTGSRKHYEASLHISRQIDHRRGVAVAVANLAQVEFAQGDPYAAGKHEAEALRLFLEIGDTINIAACLMGLACAAVLSNVSSTLAPAAELFGFALRMVEEAGGRFEPADQVVFQRHIETCKGALGHAAFTSAFERGRGLSLDEALAHGPAVEEVLDRG